ncbi:MAG: hypothetical protein JXQ90_13680 [Cyclobacteriaceae bacterium]
MKRGGVTDPNLLDDLLEHMCCMIEIEMKSGNSFTEAYNKAYQETVPAGYSEIQFEKEALLFDFSKVTVRKLTFISGYIFSMCFMVGLMLKFLNNPGNVPLLYSGCFGLMFVFVPLLIIKIVRSDPKLI